MPRRVPKPKKLFGTQKFGLIARTGFTKVQLAILAATAAGGTCLVVILAAYGWWVTRRDVPLAATMPPVREYSTPVDLIGYSTIRPRETAIAAEAPDATPTDAANPATPSKTATPTRTPTRTPTPTPSRGEPICGGPRQMFVLGMGLDQGNDSEPGHYADVIRIVRADFVNRHFSVLGISRDFWVIAPGNGDYLTELENYYGQLIGPDHEIIDPPGVYGRLSGTYRMAELYGGPGGGPGVVRQVLYTNFGITTDYYVAGDMQAFVQAVDRVGGIDVDVVSPIPGFGLGMTHMTGSQALAYSRYRAFDSDWYRMDRQTAVLKALRGKLLLRENLTSLPSIVADILSYSHTDLTQRQIAALTCLATSVDPDEGFTLYSVTSDMAVGYWTTNGSYVMVPDYNRVRALAYQFSH